MPQKRNPDAAELVRGKAGRVIGALNALLIVMKGLPLTYGKDMQEDKEPTFDAADTLSLCLAAMAGMVRDMTIDEPAMRQAAAAGFIDRDRPRRLAGAHARPAVPRGPSHHGFAGAAGRAEGLRARRAAAGGDAGGRAAHHRRRCSACSASSSRSRSRTSFGGTAPDNVRRAAAAARENGSARTE